MKRFQILFLTIPILWCIGCSQPSKNYIAKVKLAHLKLDDIYNSDMVTDVIFDAEEQNIDSLKNKSRQLFLQGIDEYKNKKNVISAISLFKESILIFPDAKTYYELGNAKLEAKQGESGLNEAEKAFSIAEILNFQPLSKIYYKKACAYNMLREANESTVSYYLQQAFEAGFSDTTLLNNDKNLKSFLNTDSYKRLMTDVILKKLKDHPENLFDLYKKSFPSTIMPFEITLEKVDMKDYHQSISYDFAKFIPEMQTSSFGRDVSHDFIFVAKLTETQNYSAVLYSSVSYFGENMQPVHTKLVTYDNEGNIISSKIFAGQFSAERIKIGKIENNEITIQDYKRIWKQPIDKVAFEDNTIEKYELIAKASFVIDDNGKILEESVPSNFTDSVVFAKN